MSIKLDLALNNLLWLTYHKTRPKETNQVSRTLLIILADLNKPVLSMVSARPPISSSSSPFTKLLGIVQTAPFTIGIINTFMFHISLFTGKI